MSKKDVREELTTKETSTQADGMGVRQMVFLMP
jgi:hypothetical protein